jgi:hypothetical protein
MGTSLKAVRPALRVSRSYNGKYKTKLNFPKSI